MNKTKGLRLTIIILEVFTAAIGVLCLHTLFSVLTTAISGETLNFKMDINESTGDMKFALNGNPKNTGFLDVTLYFEVAILDLNGQDLARNSTSVHVSAGGTNQFSLSLLVPGDIALSHSLQENKGFLEVRFTVRTLGDLVGFTNILKIRGEGGA